MTSPVPAVLLFAKVIKPLLMMEVMPAVLLTTLKAAGIVHGPNDCCGNG